MWMQQWKRWDVSSYIDRNVSVAIMNFPSLTWKALPIPMYVGWFVMTAHSWCNALLRSDLPIYTVASYCTYTQFPSSRPVVYSRPRYPGRGGEHDNTRSWQEEDRTAWKGMCHLVPRGLNTGAYMSAIWQSFWRTQDPQNGELSVW